MRRAKIVCTLGPATCTPEMVGGLIDAGMDVARLNFSHGDHDFMARLVRTVRAEAARRDRAVAILQDLQGPKIRVGKFAKGPAELVAGAEFTITSRDVPGDQTIVSTVYENLPNDVVPGHTILLDDGYLNLLVPAVEGPDVRGPPVTRGPAQAEAPRAPTGAAGPCPGAGSRTRRASTGPA